MSSDTSFMEPWRENFKRVFYEDLEALIGEKRGFSAFLLAFAGIDALAGCRYPEEQEAGVRFKRFIEAYFPKEYSIHKHDIWRQRNYLIHNFAGVFTWGHPENHLTKCDGNVLLNAEDFHKALILASTNYFDDVKKSGTIQDVFRHQQIAVMWRRVGLGGVEEWGRTKQGSSQ